jgi:hypothetical protein
LDEEGVPKELNASQLWEVTLCLDRMNYRNKETERHMKPGTETDAGAAGQRWAEPAFAQELWRAGAGKGGQKFGKWTGLARLAPGSTRLRPDKSTQVVDFPHKATVSTFLDANFTNERELGKGLEQVGTEIGRKRTQGTQKMGNSTGQTRAGSEHIRILVAIFVTERSRMFGYVRLKSLMFAFFEKKYFFPALWLDALDIQPVGDVSEMEWWSIGVMAGREGRI